MEINLETTEDPIYIKLSDYYRDKILSGEFNDGEALPSIRTLAKERKLSILTTMKAYELLVKEGLVDAVKGKGYFVKAQDKSKIAEEHKRKTEIHLGDAIKEAKVAGLDIDDLCDLIRILWEEWIDID